MKIGEHMKEQCPDQKYEELVAKFGLDLTPNSPEDLAEIWSVPIEAASAVYQPRRPFRVAIYGEKTDLLTNQ